MERFAIKIDKKLKANLYKICRLCGMDNPDMVPIISVDRNEGTCIDVEAELEMHQKINLLLGLSITKDDRMPQTMCCLCVDKINDFYEFREMCYATNAQTRKLLGLKNVKKPVMDIKPKVEVKEESIVPTPSPTTIVAPPTTANKNGNRKRKSEELALKEETLEGAAVPSKKKLRFSTPVESTVKEEGPVQTKKKLRFAVANEELTTQVFATSSKKSKNIAMEESKLKKEPSPAVTIPLPAVSNKKLRLVAPPQKELAIKKSKQKGVKNAEQKEAEIKDEIKEEIKTEPPLVAAPFPILKVPPSKAPLAKVPPAPKLKFGCNICKERFPAKVNLEAHSRTIHIPKIDRYVCTACNEVLTKSFDIKNHQLWHKLSKTPYVCGCCGESILNTYAFSRHLREHAFETPPALQVFDRECPQCHISYATNFLYNIHICAVKTKRCAGCNRTQRNDAEYLKHSAQCAKAYLNYSKHIMPSVEAQEDSVRIKNENEVEAAAEEMARISGVPIDMAPVVQLTRLSSPLIMAASQCVSTTGLDDTASTSNKKSGKKGVSKKDLKRVDELLKSTLDALVSIKHEPEVHVDQETPCAGEHSDNDDHHEEDDNVGGLDDFHHNEDSDEAVEEVNKSGKTANIIEIGAVTESGVEHIKIKQEIDETNEENSNKIGGGLKLKIKKEHGQLNSSIIEQQKSSEKRAEKRKKKKKHKEKEKDKQKIQKDAQDEQLSEDSTINKNISEANIGSTVICIKSEPQDEIEAHEKSVASVLQIRPQPEATIMTSIPMMQFQIACVSSGVEFNNATNSVVETHETMPSANDDTEPEDVKPNREELDRMLKISHVSGGIPMETGEVEGNEAQQMDHDDGNSDEADYHEETIENDHHANDYDSEQEEENQAEGIIQNNEKSSEDTGIKKKEIITKRDKKPVLHIKPKLQFNSKDKPTAIATKSRNKACKSTAKPPTTPGFKISDVQSGVMLETSAPSTSEFTPIFIKAEPQNRGYSDEQQHISAPSSPKQPEEEENQEEANDLLTHTEEERNYISSIDFNNITIKQEKDIEINDVQIPQKYVKPFSNLNGIKRKRKRVSRSHCDENEGGENTEENMEDDEEQETDDEEDENNDEDVEEEEEAEEEEDEEVDDEEDEEREYRELEYPPELIDNTNKAEIEEDNNRSSENNNVSMDEDNDSIAKKNNIESHKEVDSNIPFVIANVCSHATTGFADENLSKTNDDNITRTVNVCDTHDSALSSSRADHDDILSCKSIKESPAHSDISVVNPSEELTVSRSQADLQPTIAFNEGQADKTPVKELQANIKPSEMSLELGHPFQTISNEQLSEDSKLNPQPQILFSILHSTLQSEKTFSQAQCTAQNPKDDSGQLFTPKTQNLQFGDIKSQEIQLVEQRQPENTGQNMELNQQIYKSDSQDAQIGQENKLDSTYQQTRPNLENSVDYSNREDSCSHALLENLSNPQTSSHLQVEHEISSVKLTTLDAISEANICTSSNEKISKDNQETATVECFIQESKNLNLEARPVIDNFLRDSVNNDNEDDYDEAEDEHEEERVNNEDQSTLGNNLEERQNDQNQEVLSQIRPAALALHPYLEDISSSSNSLLSNSLSQTPPLLQPVASASSTIAGEYNTQRQEQQRLSNTEETENILNESNDVLRRSFEVAVTSAASAGQSLTQPNLVQQLPSHMPTFNFDNINEIAENNNNANIEREQLQDEQQQHQHHQN